MSKLSKEIGQKIKLIRKSKKLTQEELGNLCGLSYKFIGEIERGAVNPSMDSIVLIAEALNVTMSDFFAKDKESFFQLSHSELQTVKQSINILKRLFSQF